MDRKKTRILTRTTTRTKTRRTTVDLLNYYSKHHIVNDGIQPVAFGAKTKQIWDGASEEVRTKHMEKEKMNSG